MRLRIAETFAAVFAFRTVPTTVLVVLVYLALFSAVLITDELPTPPASAHSDLQEAFANLHRVSKTQNGPLSVVLRR